MTVVRQKICQLVQTQHSHLVLLKMHNQVRQSPLPSLVLNKLRQIQDLKVLVQEVAPHHLIL